VWLASSGSAAGSSRPSDADSLRPAAAPEGRPVRFELCRKDRAVSLRLSDAPLDAVKRAPERQGIPRRRSMRQAIEQAVAPNPPARKA
jgi:predicted DNA binding CopG/RHH family protein